MEQLADDAAKGQSVEVVEDEVPAPPDEAITKPGESFRDIATNASEAGIDPFPIFWHRFRLRADIAVRLNFLCRRDLRPNATDHETVEM